MMDDLPTRFDQDELAEVADALRPDTAAALPYAFARDHGVLLEADELDCSLLYLLLQIYVYFCTVPYRDPVIVYQRVFFLGRMDIT